MGSGTSTLVDSEYQTLEEIGRGGFGVVSKVRKKADNKIYARKDIYFGQYWNLLVNRNMVNSAAKEISILSSLRHPCIVSYIGYRTFPEKKVIGIYLEYCDGGSLADYIARHKFGGTKISENEFRHIFDETVRAVDYLHSVVILHRDIKPANILLNGKDTQYPQVKLTDFGISAVNKAGPGTLTVGTPRYMAPELLDQWKRGQSVNHTKESDIWALGKTILELGLVVNMGRSISSKKRVEILVECTQPKPALRPSAAMLRQLKLGEKDTVTNGWSPWSLLLWPICLLILAYFGSPR